MYRLAFNQLSPEGQQGRLSILILHRVLSEPDPLFPGEIVASRFDAICAWVRRWFNVLPLDEAARLLRQGSLPERAMSITFDDGYADNHDVAMPILQRHGLSATFFVATGFLDGGRMWNDTLIESVRHCRLPVLDLQGTAGSEMGVLPLHSVADRQSAIARLIDGAKYLAPVQRDHFVAAVADCSAAKLPSELMLSSAQVRALHRAGMIIGGHTVHHPILARLDDESMRQEIAQGRAELERIIGGRVGLFAYPNGKPGTDYTARTVEIVRELGFDAAVSTTWGAARTSTDVYQLPRFMPWDRSKGRFGLRLAGNLLRS